MKVLLVGYHTKTVHGSLHTEKPRGNWLTFCNRVVPTVDQDGKDVLTGEEPFLKVGSPKKMTCKVCLKRALGEIWYHENMESK